MNEKGEIQIEIIERGFGRILLICLREGTETNSKSFKI
jgi:hypothetical protein